MVLPIYKFSFGSRGPLTNVTKIKELDFNRGSHQLYQINIFEKLKDARLIWELGIHVFCQYVERHGLSFSGSYRRPCTVRKEEHSFLAYRATLRARIAIAMHHGIAFPPPHGLGKQHARCQRRNQERWSRNRRRKGRSWRKTKESRR